MFSHNIGTITIIVFVVTIVLSISVYRARPDGLLHIVFCDVGQGDAIYLRFPNGSDMLVDGGKGNQVLECLGEHMPFWDRAIDIVSLSHPQFDHYGGLAEVISRYDVGRVLLPAVGSTADSYKELIGLIEEKQTKVVILYAGDTILSKNSNKLLPNDIVGQQDTTYNDVHITVLWPEKSWTISHSRENSTMSSPLIQRTIATADDPNDFSQVLLVSYLDFDVLLTGDAEVNILEDAVDKAILRNSSLYDPIEVLKVSHHGSEKAVSKRLLNLIRTQVGVLSVGNRNKYGHPTTTALKHLEEAGAMTKRTDIDGTVEIITDGRSWKLL